MFSSSRLEQWAGITTVRQGIPLGQSLKEGAELCVQVSCVLYPGLYALCDAVAPILLLLLRTQVVWSVWKYAWHPCGVSICYSQVECMWRTDADVTVAYLVNVSTCVFWKAPCQCSMTLLIRLGILWLVMEGPQLVQIVFHGHFLVTPEGMPPTEVGHSVSAVVFDRSHWVVIRKPLQISQWEGLLLVLFLKWETEGQASATVNSSPTLSWGSPRTPELSAVDFAMSAHLRQLCDTCLLLALMLTVSGPWEWGAVGGKY